MKTELEKAAEEYATKLCGKELKDEPVLNQFVPSYMRDAFLAGAAYERKQCAEIADGIAAYTAKAGLGPAYSAAFDIAQAIRERGK